MPFFPLQGKSTVSNRPLHLYTETARHDAWEEEEMSEEKNKNNKYSFEKYGNVMVAIQEDFV